MSKHIQNLRFAKTPKLAPIDKSLCEILQWYEKKFAVLFVEG
jgi:hypothetical protein